jgi:hypothetical protein
MKKEMLGGIHTCMYVHTPAEWPYVSKAIDERATHKSFRVCGAKWGAGRVERVHYCVKWRREDV